MFLEKILRRINFNTVGSSHSISVAKKNVSCVVINIRVGEFFEFRISVADMEGKCQKYAQVIKYNCLECFTFVCNICSKIREHHDKYSEKEKLIHSFRDSVPVCKVYDCY